MASSKGHKRPINQDLGDVTKPQSKRTRTDQKRKKLTHDDYSFGWVTALPEEQAAAMAMLDEMHQDLPRKEGDNNIYTLGRIREHNIVIAGLPADGYGTVNAATVAKDMHRTFPSLRDYLMVGIAGGAGSAEDIDVRLGDIVVSDKLIQYDLGKAHHQGHFETTEIPLRPSQRLRNAVGKLKALHYAKESEIPTFIRQIAEKRPKMNTFASREFLRDLLFEDTYAHSGANDNCDKCDPSRLVKRRSRTDDNPEVHYGTIASGNSLIKSSVRRNELAGRFKALCFEMEGAGFIESLQCLVIRSICDYADSHKNKQWQPYAAAAAAAYAKELILVVPISESQAVKTVGEKLSQDQKKKLMDSLSFDAIISREMDIKPPQAHTCEWILQHPDYLAWRNPDKYHQHHGFIWIRGKPGAGKSTLMKFIYTELKSKHNALSFFFNARGNNLEQSVEGMYRSLLLQLFQEFEDLQDVFDDRLLHELSKGRLKWDHGTLRDLFTDAIAQLGQRELICLVDALDECNEDEVYDIVEHFERLGELASQKNLKLFICFSSRHYPSISVKSSVTLILEDQNGHMRDLKEYANRKLDIGVGEHVEEIKATLLHKASGIFMWMVLVVGILNKESKRRPLSGVKRRLDEIPAKLGELFKEILTKDNEHMDDLLLSIQWILYAEEPLGPEEYYYALQAGFSPEERDLAEWDPSKVTGEYTRDFVSVTSKGLAEVTKSDYPTVQFIHESVRDFLVKDGGIFELWPDLPHDFESFSHNRLKECCFTYIEARSSNVERLPDNDHYSRKEESDFQRRSPFVKYATHSVVYHAKKAAISFPQQHFFESFFESFDSVTWFRLHFGLFGHAGCEDLFYMLTYNDIDHSRSEGTECSACAALETPYKPAAIALPPLGNNCPDNAIQHPRPKLGRLSSCGSRLLHSAASCGHTKLARLLLNRGVSVDARDQWDQTPIFRSICEPEVVQLLLDRGADINAYDNNGRTPLYVAALYGNEHIVGMLLTRGAEVNTSDNNSKTPLHIAALNGNEHIVGMLLTHGAEVDATDNNGQTPLIYAAATEGSSKVVETLLAHGAKVVAADNNGKTPLHIAVQYKHLAVIETLLACGAKVDAADNNGMTPPQLAAQKHHHDTVEIFKHCTCYFCMGVPISKRYPRPNNGTLQISPRAYAIASLSES